MNKLTDQDREDILALDRIGKSSNEIQAIFKGMFTRQQIAAVKAWKTIRNTSEPIPKTRKLTDIARNSIISMIDKGKGTNEIMERLKYQFSRQQIAAVRAHMTMNTY